MYHMHTGAHGDQNPGTEVTGVCEPPDVGAGNGIKVLWKNSTVGSWVVICPAPCKFRF